MERTDVSSEKLTVAVGDRVTVRGSSFISAGTVIEVKRPAKHSAISIEVSVDDPPPRFPRGWAAYFRPDEVEPLR